MGKQRRIIFWAILGLFLMAGCTGNVGCSGCAKSCGGDPNYKFTGSVVSKGAKFRLTQKGADFISQNLKPLVEAALKKAGYSLDCAGKGIQFPSQAFGNGPKANGKPVKPSSSNCGIKVKRSGIKFKAACTGNTPPSTWFYSALNGSSVCGRLETKSLKITLDEPSNGAIVEFSIPEIRIRSQQPDLGICYKTSVKVIPGQICLAANVSLNSIEMKLTNLAGKIKFLFYTDPKTGKVGIKVAPPPAGIQFSSSSRFSLKLNGCKSITVPINIPVINKKVNIKLPSSLCSTVTKILQSLVNSSKVIQPLLFRGLGLLLANQLKKTNLIADAKAEFSVPLEQVMSKFSLPAPPGTKDLGLLFTPKEFKVIRQGLSMLFDGGFVPVGGTAACVPVRPQPQTPPGPEPPFSSQSHFGMGLSKPIVDRALWAAHQAGVLCMKLNSSQINALSGSSGFSINAGTLAILIPDLSKVAPQSAPVMFGFEPLYPPTVSFGTGKTVNNNPDPLIKLRMADFGISFYVYIYDRYVRIFKLLVDFEAGLDIVPLPNNQLELAFDPKALKINNPRATKAYLVKVPDMAKFIKVVLNLMLQTVGNKKFSFKIDLDKQLSSALGVPIGMKFDRIAKSGPAGDWLGIELTFLKKGGLPLLPEFPYPGLLANSVYIREYRISPTSSVKIDVPEFVDGRPVEYQYLVDFGLWSKFQRPRGGKLTVVSEFFNLPGRHTIYLRARYSGEYRTLVTVPSALEVEVKSPLKLVFKQNTALVRALLGEDAPSLTQAEPQAPTAVSRGMTCDAALSEPSESFGFLLLVLLALAVIVRRR